MMPAVMTLCFDDLPFSNMQLNDLHASNLLTQTAHSVRMINCDDLIGDLHAIARDHVPLAALAEAASVAEMHIDLAMFSEAQAFVAEEVCEDV